MDTFEGGQATLQRAVTNWLVRRRYWPDAHFVAPRPRYAGTRRLGSPLSHEVPVTPSFPMVVISPEAQIPQPTSQRVLQSHHGRVVGCDAVSRIAVCTRHPGLPTGTAEV